MNNDIEKRLAVIEARNRRVEDDKAWEISIVRKLLVASLTFFLIGLYLSWLEVDRPWLNAVVPSLGFLLSTLVVQWAKTVWLRDRR